MRAGPPARPALVVSVGRNAVWIAFDDEQRIRPASLRKQGDRFALVPGDRVAAQPLDDEWVVVESREPAALFEALAKSRGDVVNVRTFLSPATLYSLYAAADAVLANSGKEPFGLVGLEVMASGGLAVCGSTGEEYAEPFVNAIVVDTEDGRELAEYLRAAVGDAAPARAMRAAGRATAARYTWPTVVEGFERKIAFAEMLQH